MINPRHIMTALLACLCWLSAPATTHAQNKTEEWKAPKRQKVRWKAPKWRNNEPVVDVWRPYDVSENWWFDVFGGFGSTFGENFSGHGIFSAMGPLGGAAIGHQTSYLFSTRFVFEYASQFGWIAEGGTLLPSVIRPGKYNYKTMELWLDERVSLTNALCPYDDYRKVNVQLFAGAGMNYSAGADNRTKMWEMFGKDVYGVKRHNSINLALRCGVQVQYAITPSVDAWGQTAFNMLGDKHNALTHEGGKLEPCIDFTFGVSVHMPDRYNDYRFRKLRKTEALLMKGQEPRVDQYFAREAQRQETRRLNEKVEFGKAMQAKVAFYTDRVFINDEQLEHLEAVAHLIKHHDDVNILVRGYSGASRGCETQGMELAKRRAEAVRQALVQTYGVDPSRLSLWHDENAESPLPMRGEWIDAVVFEMVPRK